jgi:hypothetical protein
MPVVSLAAVVTVAVHKVLGGKLAAGTVIVAVLLDARYVTVVPVTVAPAGQARVKLAVVSVAGSIALLNVALIDLTLIDTPVVLSTGATAVTEGAVPRPPLPRIEPCPPISHPVTNTVINSAMSRHSGLVRFSNLSICFFFSSLIQENILAKPHLLASEVRSAEAVLSISI